MTENNRCTKCKYVYELLWDDTNDDYYNDEDEDDFSSVENEELYPEYCPFCGTHRAYGTENDSMLEDY